MLDSMTDAAVRQNCLLLLAYDLADGRADVGVSSERFKHQAWERFGVSYRVQRHDLLALSRQRFVRNYGMAAGLPEFEITPRGTDRAEAFQLEQRRQPARFASACTELLDWLYVESAAKSGGIEIVGFLAEAVGYLGLKYSAPEVHDALAWLKAKGFVKPGAGPVLNVLTEQGFESIESGMNVNEFCASVLEPRPQSTTA